MGKIRLRSLEAIRLLLATREPCSPDCPGWDVFFSDAAPEGFEGLKVERCDECWLNARNHRIRRDAPSDEELAQLPECQAAWREALEASREPIALRPVHQVHRMPVFLSRLEIDVLVPYLSEWATRALAEGRQDDAAALAGVGEAIADAARLEPSNEDDAGIPCAWDEARIA